MPNSMKNLQGNPSTAIIRMQPTKVAKRAVTPSSPRNNGKEVTHEVSKKKSNKANKPDWNRKDEERRRQGLDDDAEFASEVAPFPAAPVKTEDDAGQVGNELETTRVLGWVALIAAIVSLFFLPTVLGPAAAVLGFITFLQGNRTMGAWSIVLGLASLFVALFLSPYY